MPAMKIPFELWVGARYTLAGRSAKRNSFISFISGISMLGIALGVAALIIVLSVMNGFQRDVRDRMLGVVSHIEINNIFGQALTNPKKIMTEVRKQKQVIGAAPYISSQALLARGSDMQGMMLRGIDPDLEPEVNTFVVGNGQEQILQKLRAGSFGIVLGIDLARKLGVGIGDHVILIAPSGDLTPIGVVPRLKQLTVVGLFNSGYYDFDATMGMMAWQDVAKIFHFSGPTGVRVRLSNLDLAPQVAKMMQQQLGPDFLVRDWTQQNKNWFDAVQVEKRMMFIILTLIVAVAAFNLVSTLVMTVTEKRSDIAILRTLGVRPASIMSIFIVQGAVSGVAGTLIGLILGLLVAYNLDVIVPFIEQIFHVQFLPKSVYLISYMPSDPKFSDILPIVVISLIMAFLATIWPSWQASRINPAAELRHE
jgi:lipoprotein-releasing system permease protein